MRLRWGVVIAILAIAGTIGVHELKATPHQMLGSPCVVVVPRDWGEFKGLSKSGLVFGAADGLAARHRHRQLLRHPRAGNGAAAIAGRDADPGREQARLQRMALDRFDRRSRGAEHPPLTGRFAGAIFH